MDTPTLIQSDVTCRTPGPLKTKNKKRAWGRARLHALSNDHTYTKFTEFMRVKPTLLLLQSLLGHPLSNPVTIGTSQTGVAW